MEKAVLTVETFLKAPVACLAVRGELRHVKKVNLKIIFNIQRILLRRISHRTRDIVLIVEYQSQNEAGFMCKVYNFPCVTLLSLHSLHWCTTL